MHKIFNINTSKKLWIDTNSAQTHLSEIELTDEYCIIPMHIYEDSLCDDDEINNVIIFNNNHVKVPRSYFNKVQFLRNQSYRACIWYPEIKNKIPTAESKLIPIQNDKKIKKYISCYPFVRLCTMSSKDIINPPIYNNWENALIDLKNSSRTNDLLDKPFCENCQGKHIFLRKIKNYDYEARCFWSRGKLRAVSLSDIDNINNDILKFFEKYQQYIPYHSATIDIGITNNNIELIEFNSFGPDMNATSGNFSWIEDVYTLLYSEKTIFR